MLVHELLRAAQILRGVHRQPDALVAVAAQLALPGELNRLNALGELRREYGVGIDELAFAARLRREPDLRARVDGWLAAGADTGSWIDWEQRKHERLLAA